MQTKKKKQAKGGSEPVFLKQLFGNLQRPAAGQVILAVLLFAAFFVRSYRTNDLLRFYFDQGRDALVIHKMIHTPKPVLVGPTTGLAGILRGPFFYYLLLPGYLVGQGSPVVAAIWLQIINIIGLYFIYLSAKTLFSPIAGLVAVFLVGFSNHLVSLSRWLSNPSPIFTTVPIMLYGLIQIIKQSEKRAKDGSELSAVRNAVKDSSEPPAVCSSSSFWYVIVALMLGLNLQLEIASEIWFIPAVFLFFLLQKKYWPSLKTLIYSISVFLLTLVPQVAFDFRHDHIMFKAIKEHFTNPKEPSFVFSLPKLIERWQFFQDTFATLLVPQNYLYLTLVLILTFFVSFTIKKYQTSQNYLLLWLLLFPLSILSFYQGNQGNFYSYYLIGLFPLFIILVSGGIAHFFKKPNWAIVSILILFLFTSSNFTLVKNFLTDDLRGSEQISFKNQLEAMDWIYQQAEGQDFNLDVYVPPVVPYSYDYLFLWYGQKKYHHQPTQNQLPLLFTLTEVDPPHPGRLQAWMDRQSNIGEVKKQQKFAGIAVHRRHRY